MGKGRVELRGGPSDGLPYLMDDSVDYLKIKLVPEGIQAMNEINQIRARAGQPFDITIAIYERCSEDPNVMEHVAYERERMEGADDAKDDGSFSF